MRAIQIGQTIVAAAVLVGASASCKTADPAARAGRALEAALKKEAGGKPIKVRTDDGALDTRVVTAAVEGAYPGTGVYRVIVDRDGKSYGLHGERGLADLVRARGWLKAPPAADGLARLVNDAQFEGLLALDESEPPAIKNEGDGISLQFARVNAQTAAHERYVAHFPAEGAVRVSLARPPGQPTNLKAAASPDGSDAVAQLSDALGKRDAFALKRAIRAASGSTDPRVRPLLARATTIGNDAIAADAIQALGAGADSAALLGAAWKTVAPDVRAKLLATATDLHGADFAAKIK